MTFYRRQLKLNNLQILCDKCNGKKRNQLQLNPYLLDNPKYDPYTQPF
jgi:5-methylcytosine-specific restriction endonuclease McrA